MKKLYILFICLSIIGGCTTKKESKIKTGNFIINNGTLINNLQEYYKKNLAKVPFEYLLTIDITQKEDTNIFVISYDMNLFALINNPPLMYIKVNNIDVAIRNNLVHFIELTTEYQEQQFEKYLPTQFKMYKEQGEIPPPTTFRNEVWVLKFKGNKFVSRKIIND